MDHSQKPIIWSPGLLLAPFVRQYDLNPIGIRDNDYLETLLSGKIYDPVNSPSGKATSALSQIGALDTLLTDNESEAQEFLQIKNIPFDLKRPSWSFTSYDLHPLWLEPIESFASEGIEYLNLGDVSMIRSPIDDKVVGGTFQLSQNILGWVSMPSQPIYQEQELHEFVRSTEENLIESSALVRLSFPSVSFELITISHKLKGVEIDSFSSAIQESILINKFLFDGDNINEGVISRKFDSYQTYVNQPSPLKITRPFVLALGLPNYGIVWAAYLPPSTWKSTDNKVTTKVIKEMAMDRNVSSHMDHYPTGGRLIYSNFIPYLPLYEATSIKPRTTQQNELIEIFERDPIMKVIGKFSKIKTSLNNHRETMRFAASYGLEMMINPSRANYIPIYALTVFESKLRLKASRIFQEGYQIRQVKSWNNSFLVPLDKDVNLIILKDIKVSTREELATLSINLGNSKFELKDLIIPGLRFQSQMNFSFLNGVTVTTKLGDTGIIVQTLTDYHFELSGQLINDIYEDNQSEVILLDQPFVLAIISKQIGKLLVVQVEKENFLNIGNTVSYYSGGVIERDRGIREPRERLRESPKGNRQTGPVTMPNDVLSLVPREIRPLNKVSPTSLQWSAERHEKSIQWLRDKMRSLIKPDYEVKDIELNPNKIIEFDDLRIKISPDRNLQFTNTSGAILYIMVEKLTGREFFSLNPHESRTFVWPEIREFTVVITDDDGLVTISNTLYI